MSNLKRSAWRYGSRVLALLAASAVAIPAAAQTAAGRQVTYNKDIAPILERSCANCHRPDSIAPMSLLNYKEAKPFARAMKQRTALARSKYGRNAMPPWYIEKNIGIQNFKDDPSLSDEEIALIATWADNGAPEGNPADLKPPSPLAKVTQWSLGKPDLIASTPTITMPGIGPDLYPQLNFPPSPLTGLTEDRFVSAAEYKEVPVGSREKDAAGTVGNLYLIHHAGGSITHGPPENQAGTFSLTTHEVGRNATPFPDTAGVPLKVGSAVVWSAFHLHSPGVPGERSSTLQVGLKLHPRGYEPRYTLSSISAMGNTEIEVSPGNSSGRSQAYFVTPQPMILVNFEPHMHAAGVRKCIEAIYQRSIETLNCSGYDHNWVRSYQYDENYAPLVPKGTIIKITGWLDNSAKNANVIEPRNQGVWGRRSVVNMLINEGNMIMLTDEQYEQELAQRRAFLDKTDSWDNVIGCPGCWEIPPAEANAQEQDKNSPAAKATAKGQKATKTTDLSEGSEYAAPSVD